MVKTFISGVQSESTSTSIKLSALVSIIYLVSIGKMDRHTGGWGLVGGAMCGGACRLGKLHGLLFCFVSLVTCTV